MRAASNHRTCVLSIILISYLMIVLDISIVITALPKIRDSLGFSATGLSWVQNAYTLAFGGLLLLGARAGDILGRRRMFIAGLALFTVASLAIGLAQSSTWLIAARALQIASSSKGSFDSSLFLFDLSRAASSTSSTSRGSAPRARRAKPHWP